MSGTVRLIRRVSFSSGHRFWVASLSEEENRARFGKWASPYNHGHNYVLEVAAEGKPDPETAMVVNIKDIDDCLQSQVVEELDGRSINDEVSHFRVVPATLENLLLYLRDRVVLPDAVELTGLRLEEMPTLWANLDRQGSDWKMTLTRTYEFAASHRLYSPNLSQEENDALFGKCSNEAGHGHNYTVEVTVSGELDERTGMMVDLVKLDDEVARLVVDRYDHKNLNVDLPEFRGKMTTSEAVVQEIWRALDGKLPAKLERVRLQETARSSFEVSAG